MNKNDCENCELKRRYDAEYAAGVAEGEIIRLSKIVRKMQSKDKTLRDISQLLDEPFDLIRQASLYNETKWFRSAAKSALILKVGIQEDEAEKALSQHNFDKKLTNDPTLALRYDPAVIADEIIETL